MLYNHVMGISEQIIDKIVQRVNDAVSAERIILFGSAALGEMTLDSDIDLLILKQNIEDPWGERRRVREALRDLPYPFDIILMTVERFEETKSVIGGISYPAFKRGKIIYEAA